MKNKIFRVTTVASTMNVILKGQLNFLNNYFNVIGATAPFDHYFNEIKTREGVYVYKINFSRRISVIKDFKALVELIWVFKKEKPSIVHSQTPKANLLSMLAAYFCRVPIRIISIVGVPIYNEQSFLGKILKSIDSLTFFLATDIFPNSNGLLSYYENNMLLKNKMRMIGNGSSNGIDFKYFNRLSVKTNLLENTFFKYNLNPSYFYFIFVGRIVNDKGIRELVDAFNELSNIKVFDHCRLLLVGPSRESDDPLSSEYKSKIATNNKIVTVGLQKDVRPFLHVSSVFVFPSYREGLPGSLLQAAAMELPLIASKIIGNEEVVNQVGGILFKARSTPDLLNAMKFIYIDSDYRNKLKSNVRKLAKEFYSQEFYWNSLLHEYQLILKR